MVETVYEPNKHRHSDSAGDPDHREAGTIVRCNCGALLEARHSMLAPVKYWHKLSARQVRRHRRKGHL